MTEDVLWSQQLVDKHAVNMLNLIRKLPLHEKVLMLLEVETKLLISHVASDALHEGKKICLESLERSKTK